MENTPTLRINQISEMLYVSEATVRRDVDANGEITDVSQTETALRRAAIKRGIKAIFLCDSSKAGRIYPHHVCYKSEIAEIITDSDFPYEYL